MVNHNLADFPPRKINIDIMLNWQSLEPLFWFKKGKDNDK